MDNESVNSAISNDSEFQLVSNRTPHRRHDIIKECNTDEPICRDNDSKTLPLCESKLLSGLSSEIEQQRENESTSHIFTELTNSTSSTMQQNDGLFVEQLKKWSIYAINATIRKAHRYQQLMMSLFSLF